MLRWFVAVCLGVAAYVAPSSSPTVVLTHIYTAGDVRPSVLEAARREAVADALGRLAPAQLRAFGPARFGAARADSHGPTVAGPAGTGRHLLSAVEVEEVAQNHVRIRVASRDMLASHAVAQGVEDRLRAHGLEDRLTLSGRTDRNFGLWVAYLVLAASVAVLLTRVRGALRRSPRRP